MTPARTAVVVGGGSGIGRGTALALARRGYHLLIADLRLETAEAVAAEVGGSAVAVDITVPAQVEGLVRTSYQRLDHVDLLVNSAGIAMVKPLAEARRTDWDAIMEVNFFGIVETCRAFVPRMRADGGGHILNNASIAALTSQDYPGLGPYTVSKQALLAYSEFLRTEEAPHGINVSLLAAGRVASGLEANTAQYLAGEVPSAQAETPRAAGMMSAEEAGDITVRGIEDGRFLILTHPDRVGQMMQRHQDFAAEIAAQRSGTDVTQ